MINVLYASDDNYAPIAGVSLTSLLENNQDVEQIHIWFMEDNVSESNIEKLKKTVDKYSRQITFLNAAQNADKVRGLGARAWFGGGFTTYCRLFLADYIGDVDRLLYLDCDTIVDQSIDQLWNYDLKGKTMGMVCDYINAGIREVIGLRSTDKYYNAGVLLVDVDLWKKRKCQDRILWHMKNVNAQYPCVDQDLINIVLKDEIKTLPWNWNVFPYYYTYSFKNIQKQYDLNAVNQYSEEEYGEGVTIDGKPNAMILHYTATIYGKPWYVNSCDPNRDRWYRYYEMSEWYGSYKLVSEKLNFMVFLTRKIIKVVPQSVYLFIFRYFSRKYMKSYKESLKGIIDKKE